MPTFLQVAACAQEGLTQAPVAPPAERIVPARSVWLTGHSLERQAGFQVLPWRWALHSRGEDSLTDTAAKGSTGVGATEDKAEMMDAS
ncbi:hypothetical protein CLDAP_33610 [Caldilinea aerophila DSM 14535 = NBRC 104270]|uniref:Uncharacterized protein n=1 Tax=Caldilinea aerophila (strain DSM 14535 / JCM 11387 / NBRC 104270 / STL-6-O1) TaxID=926550 RepID=I0I813_CALAS|nr:hypothetical protein CLDAP_33610 [Caldilinea aerophila DSM 14535 = NBRC 104270]